MGKEEGRELVCKMRKDGFIKYNKKDVKPGGGGARL